MKLFKLLFKDSEKVCIGNQFETKLSTQYKTGEFFCINPLNGPRSDLNVAQLRNFLFEVDTVPLDEQLAALESVKHLLASIVYSGGKSYHAIISLEQAIEPNGHAAIEKYKRTWEALASYLERKMGHNIKFDSACKNPSRLSRFPGYLRANGNEQTLMYVGRMLSNDELHDLIGDIVVKPKPIYQVPENSSKTEEEMKLMMPVELYNRLRFPQTWAASAGMYPELLRLVLWLIDSTGAPQDVVVSFLSKYTFPGLLKAGYPADKLLKPVVHAYNMKGHKP